MGRFAFWSAFVVIQLVFYVRTGSWISLAAAFLGFGNVTLVAADGWPACRRWVLWTFKCRRGRRCANLVVDQAEFFVVDSTGDETRLPGSSTLTHDYTCAGRGVVHGYDNRRDPGTFCGKPWRHPDHGYIYFDVVANVDRGEALKRISCVACQVELA